MNDMKMQLAEIAKAVGSVPEHDERQAVITSVSFDTRSIQPGALFIPLSGARDGHDFIDSAIANGASAAFWQKGHPGAPTDFPLVEVDDPLTAFQDLAKHYLNKVNPTVVSITGSNGKTTTKDMIAAVLSKGYNVYKTQQNFNNLIGVPYTILSMKPSTEVLVLEMGMDRPGQLHHLSELVRPDVCVITMIGEAHIEFFGTRDKIADAKMEITDFLREDGEFIFNGDEPLLRARAKKLVQRQRTFGFEDDDTIYCTGFSSYKHHASFFINGSKRKFRIPMIGKHNVSNAMAAINVGRHFNVPDEQIAAALAHFKPTANRMEWVKGTLGEDIMDDVYNSNPTAAKAVLTSFANVRTTHGGKRIAVLGDMLELGEESPQLHASLASSLDPDVISDVYLYGPDMHYLYDAIKSKYGQHVHYYETAEQAQMTADLKTIIKPHDLVMLKGSHGMHLEKVLVQLQQEGKREV
jgi:UDP-N-acetylmuramoyl-tripeptide--D-alanyl-D-alanine ligase